MYRWNGIPEVVTGLEGGDGGGNDGREIGAENAS